MGSWQILIFVSKLNCTYFIVSATEGMFQWCWYVCLCFSVCSITKKNPGYRRAYKLPHKYNQLFLYNLLPILNILLKFIAMFFQQCTILLLILSMKLSNYFWCTCFVTRLAVYPVRWQCSQLYNGELIPPSAINPQCITLSAYQNNLHWHTENENRRYYVTVNSNVHISLLHISEQKFW